MYKLMPHIPRGSIDNTFRPSDQTHGVATSHMATPSNAADQSDNTAPANAADQSDSDENPTPPPTSPPRVDPSIISDFSGSRHSAIASSSGITSNSGSGG